MLKSKRPSPNLGPPLETLLEAARGRVLPLPQRLALLYGAFRMSKPRSRSHVFSNFVSTLDGVVSFQVKGTAAAATSVVSAPRIAWSWGCCAPRQMS